MRGRARHVPTAIAARAPFLALCALPLALFMLPLALTGAPLMFFGDSASYITQAVGLRDLALELLGGAEAAPGHDWQPSLGRSLHYSAFFGAGYALSPVWGTPTLQIALTLGALAWLGARLAALDAADDVGDRGADGAAAEDRARGALLLCLAAGLSSAPWFAGLIMPDIFSALGILAVAALMALHDRLGTAARGGLALLALASAAMHDTHLLVLGAMTAAAFVPGALAPGPAGEAGRRARRRTRTLLAGLCAAGAVLSALNAPLMTRIAGQPPARLPFLSAHLIDMGPGRDYLAARCPQAGFALCAFEIAPEATWEQILFTHRPGLGVYNLADPPTRIALGEEQVRFALSVMAFAPAATAAGLAADGAAQLGRFSLASLDPQLSDWNRYVRRLPPPLRARYGDGYALAADRAHARALLGAASAWIAAGAAAGAAGLVFAAVRLGAGRRGAGPASGPNRAAARRLRLAGLLVAGLILNGLICGMIASPYDRFQARAIWLVPVAAALVLPAALRRRTAAEAPRAPVFTSEGS